MQEDMEEGGRMYTFNTLAYILEHPGLILAVTDNLQDVQKVKVPQFP